MDEHREIDEELLTPKDVAKIIKRSYRTVVRLLEEGHISYYRPTPRTYLISKTALYSWLEGTKNS